MISLKLYRYRNVQRALEEIEKGTWYFASREELNDPIEGYVRVYWQGDKPAWTGLFRNYICSLCIAIQRYLVTDENSCVNKSFDDVLKDFRNHVVLRNIHQFDNVPMGKVLAELFQNFLNDPMVEKFINFYGSEDLKCSAKELRSILTAIHSTAFSVCVEKMQQLGIISQDYIEIMSFMKPFPIEQIKFFSKEERKKILEFSSDMIADNFEEAISFKFNIPQDSSEMSFEDKQLLLFFKMQLDYPSMYVSQLSELLYPAGYVICFSKYNNNSAMWGNYAQNHIGVCLVYETNEFNGKNVISTENKKVEVAEVKYSNEILQKNFFDTLAYMTYDELKTWLTDEQGNSSKYLREYPYYSSKYFHGNYWKDYKEKFFTKLESWKNEDEYRALISSLDSEKNRILKYDTTALKGIIFGIKTSVEDKIRLIQKVRATELHSDFKFYQAEYDDDLQEIKIREKIFQY